jgi:hypothetical protein
MFDFLYEPYEKEKAVFGEHWCGPNKYDPWKPAIIAVYTKPDGSDGQTVTVYCVATPARFYELEVSEGKDSIGERQNGYKITTGSGLAEVAALIAKEISTGMLEFEPNDNDKGATP